MPDFIITILGILLGLLTAGTGFFVYALTANVSAAIVVAGILFVIGMIILSILKNLMAFLLIGGVIALAVMLKRRWPEIQENFARKKSEGKRMAEEFRDSYEEEAKQRAEDERPASELPHYTGGVVENPGEEELIIDAVEVK